MTDHHARLSHPPRFEISLLSRVEDAGINASAPPQQRWVDGWLLRFSPGKAKRARCIQAVADGRLALSERLAICATVFAEAGLPMVVRITPFSRPDGLDAQLAMLGYLAFDDTRVMVSTQFPAAAESLPEGVELIPLDAAGFAAVVGELRGSPAGQRAAQAERLAASPVPYRGFALRRIDDCRFLACGQTAAEGDLVGLYDVHTRTSARGQGLARRLCSALLVAAQSGGARAAYLQVDSDNAPALAIYRRLGFADAYRYHYRAMQPEAA